MKGDVVESGYSVVYISKRVGETRVNMGPAAEK